MISRMLVLSSIAGFSILFTGCATMFGGGSKQTVTIHSATPKQIMYGHTEDGNTIIGTELYANVPGTINVSRENKNLLIKDKNGDCQKKVIEKQTNPWFLGDILPISPLSTTVDAVTGALWVYDNNVTIECK